MGMDCRYHTAFSEEADEENDSTDLNLQMIKEIAGKQTKSHETGLHHDLNTEAIQLLEEAGSSHSKYLIRLLNQVITTRFYSCM